MINFHFIAMVCFFIIGLNYATDYDLGTEFKQDGYKNLLWKVREFTVNRVGEFWAKPLLTCVVCMSSVWTTVLYIVDHLCLHLKQPLSIDNLIQWAVSIVVVAGVNRVLKNFF